MRPGQRENTRSMCLASLSFLMSSPPSPVYPFTSMRRSFSFTTLSGFFPFCSFQSFMGPGSTPLMSKEVPDFSMQLTFMQRLSSAFALSRDTLKSIGLRTSTVASLCLANSFPCSLATEFTFVMYIPAFTGVFSKGPPRTSTTKAAAGSIVSRATVLRLPDKVTSKMSLSTGVTTGSATGAGSGVVEAVVVVTSTASSVDFESALGHIGQHDMVSQCLAL
mmetsp:Transcript_116616/g.249350  ORF Transcript_116616/g.249350 Transcript_116616/m.249350 type:complete len:220 (+) Transcript_116616:121-780(+)